MITSFISHPYGTTINPLIIFLSISSVIDILGKLSEIVENTIFYLIFVLWKIWCFRHFWKIKKKWYLQKCRFSRTVNILKSDAKHQKGRNLRRIIKIFNENNLPHELLLTARQKTNLTNAFESNMSTEIKWSKTQIFKIIQSGGFLVSLLCKISDPLMKAAVPLAKNILAL